MPHESTEKATQVPDLRPPLALAETAADADTRADSRGGGRKSAKEPFVYARLLAYHRGQLRDPLEVRRIEAELEASPSWRAHRESIRHFDLEREAADRDGEALQAFRPETAGRLCFLVAISDGEPFARAAREPAALDDETRRAWAEHVRGCVYCRRMRRLASARVEAERAGLPRREPLLREWLLDHRYAEALKERTDEIVKRFRRQALGRLVERLPDELKSLVVDHLQKQMPLEELVRRGGVPVEAMQGRIDDAMQQMRRSFRDDALVEIEGLFRAKSESHH